MEKVRPNQDRAKAAVILIYVVMGIELIDQGSDFLQLQLLWRFQSGVNVTTSEAQMNDIRVTAIALIYMAAYIVSAVMFIRWFRRAYFNLHLVAKRLTYTEGWAAGSWFVPFINLFRPYQIMKELYEETEIVLAKRNLTPRVVLPGTMVGVWWTLWIINNVAGQIIFRSSREANTLGEMIFGTQMGIFVNFISIPLALVTIKVIRDYAKVEHLITLPEEDKLTLSDAEDLLD